MYLLHSLFIIEYRTIDPTLTSAQAQLHQTPSLVPLPIVSTTTTTSTSTPTSSPTSSRQTHSRRSQPLENEQINFAAIIQTRERKQQQIMSTRIQRSPYQETYGKLFDQILENSDNDDFTFHLGLPALIELGNSLLDLFRGIPRRGAQYSLSAHGSLFIYLMWLSTSATQKFLSKTMTIHPSTFSRTVDTVRPILNKYLKQRFQTPPRPEINPTSPFPEVALIVDATTVTIATPALTFDERKEYYDGHHGCYSMKIEVGVNPRPPYQALFVSEVVKGAVHDITLFRQGLSRYITYLHKQPNERDLLPADSFSDMYAIMADKGYIGQFPGLRIITPSKHYQSQAFPPSSAISIPSFLPSPSDSPTQSRQLQFTQSMTTTTTSAYSHTSSSSSSSPSSPSQNISYSSPHRSTTAASSYSSPSSLVDNQFDVDRNLAIARTRIPVEWFFGRMKRLWLRLAGRYSGDRDKLPEDPQNACYLTNLSIFHKNLVEEDGEFETRALQTQITRVRINQQLREVSRDAVRKRDEIRQSPTLHSDSLDEETQLQE